MPRHTCDCGARFRFPDSAIGKRSKCKQCGAVFTLFDDEAGVIPVAEDIGASPDAVPEQNQPARQGKLFVPTSLSTRIPPVGPDEGQIAGDALKPSFSTDVLWTFLFPSSPGNLVTFLVIWVVMLIMPIVPFGLRAFSLIVWILINGWYTAFLFAVLQSAAAGEQELPSPTFSRDLVDDLVYPLFQWIGSWVVVYIPACVYLLLACLGGNVDPFDALQLTFGGIERIFQQGGGQPPAFSILVCVGVFFWPMIILCIALGGFETVYRFDLIVSTIIRTFPVYVATLLLMFGAALLERTLTASTAGVSMWFVISIGLTVYFDIVLMRLIGLYYHHFKDRFAWSWG
jgi:hypothetical protein